MAGSPDNHVAAMTLLIPWMDQALYVAPANQARARPNRLWPTFFPEIEGYELGRLDRIRDRLKHIGYAGKKCALLDSVQTINLMGNVEVMHDQRFLTKPYTLLNDILLIHPTAEHVRGQIDAKPFCNGAGIGQSSCRCVVTVSLLGKTG